MTQRNIPARGKVVRVLTKNMFVDLGPGAATELVSAVRLGTAFKPEAGAHFLPYQRNLRAVWDTGAFSTTITAEIAAELQLETLGQAEIHGVTGSSTGERYLVSIHLPNDVIIPELEVTSCTGNIGCDVLIGMDVISLGDFAVNTFRGNTTFTFRMPSIECMDFTKHLASTAISGHYAKREKTGRNEKCPCGSGKKYKKCCGRNKWP